MRSEPTGRPARTNKGLSPAEMLAVFCLVLLTVDLVHIWIAPIHMWGHASSLLLGAGMLALALSLRRREQGRPHLPLQKAAIVLLLFAAGASIGDLVTGAR